MSTMGRLHRRLRGLMDRSWVHRVSGLIERSNRGQLPRASPVTSPSRGQNRQKWDMNELNGVALDEVFDRRERWLDSFPIFLTVQV